jgi:hypothetical protein
MSTSPKARPWRIKLIGGGEVNFATVMATSKEHARLTAEELWQHSYVSVEIEPEWEDES